MHELRAIRLTCPSACSSRYSQPMITRFRRCVAAESPLRAPTGVLNATADFKVPGGSLRRNGYRILFDRHRDRIRDHRDGSGHRTPTQHQIQFDKHVAEIAARYLFSLSARITAIRANIIQPPPVSAALIRFSTAIGQVSWCWTLSGSFMM